MTVELTMLTYSVALLFVLILVQATVGVRAQGLTPIFCCGEPLEIRETGTHEKLVKQQVEEALFHLSADALQKIVIAFFIDTSNPKNRVYGHPFFQPTILSPT